MSGIDIEKRKISKISNFIIFFNYCQTIDRICELECKKPLNNEKVVVSVSFRQQIRTISNSKVLEIDLEVVEKFDDFVVFDAIAVQFPKVFVIKSITLNNERTSYAIHFLKRTLPRFASKTPTFFCFQYNRF